MITWLSRSLLFIVVGSVLAFAVTVQNDTIDIQTSGVILLLVGIFDLLLNFGLSMYLRQPPRSVDPYARAVAATQRGMPVTTPRSTMPTPGVAYPDRPVGYPDRPVGYPDRPTYQDRPVSDPDRADDEVNATRPIRRDDPNWH
jgi:hypothetical protein